MDNLENFDKFNEGIKDKVKFGWEKFKAGLHPWDYSLEEWNDKFENKPKPNRKVLDPNDEENWEDEPKKNISQLPVNPYSVHEFNELMRNREIISTTSDLADFVWNYRNGKVVYFRKIV